MATEIQAIKIPICGSCSFSIGDYFMKGGKSYLYNGEAIQPTTIDTVWLPTFSQLDELILKHKEYSIYVDIVRLSKIANRTYFLKIDGCFYRNSHIFQTYDKLGLVYVMLELYSKLWDIERKEWVSI